MLEDKEFKRLQKLANITLSGDEAVKLGTQLDNIIKFLGQLDQIKISSPKKNKKTELSLRTIPGHRQFPDTDKLLKNVKHPIVNNSIVVKSVLD